MDIEKPKMQYLPVFNPFTKAQCQYLNNYWASMSIVRPSYCNSGLMHRSDQKL